MIKTKFTDNVIIPLNDSGTEFKFGNNFNIQNYSKILGIEAYGQSQLSKAPNGKTIVNDAAFKSAFITLRMVEGNKDATKTYPLVSLCPNLNNGMVREFDISKLNVSECSITLGNTAAIVAGEVVLLIFHLQP